MAKIKQPSAAVLAARARRGQQNSARGARVEWYLKNVSDVVQMTLKQRVTLATRHLRDQVLRNISKSVGRGTTKSGKTIVTERSKPGEFPRADTTQLMKSIFDEVRQTSKNQVDGYVGTPIDYGAILETSVKLNRSFLVRTLNEETGTIKRILTGPLKK